MRIALLLFSSATLIAATYTPKKPEPAKPLTAAQKADFTKVIQPMFDAHCVSCHGPKKEKGKRKAPSAAIGSKDPKIAKTDENFIDEQSDEDADDADDADDDSSYDGDSDATEFDKAKKEMKKVSYLH